MNSKHAYDTLMQDLSPQIVQATGDRDEQSEFKAQVLQSKAGSENAAAYEKISQENKIKKDIKYKTQEYKSLYKDITELSSAKSTSNTELFFAKHVFKSTPRSLFLRINLNALVVFMMTGASGATPSKGGRVKTDCSPFLLESY